MLSFCPLTPEVSHVNVSAMNEILKRGRGRPKGASVPNVISINIDELLQKLDKINCTQVKVSRTWLLDLDKMTNISDTMSESDASDKIEFKIS
jgi:hypothetical protein